jgi:tripartite-type tricarboxylate transporter receptor subunit TctC
MRRSSLKRVIHCVVLALAATVFTPAAALAQPSGRFPQKPVFMMVGYGAGGATDLCMRAIAQGASAELGHNVQVENKPGAGSSVSIAQLVTRAPDGYTLASFSSGALINQFLRKDITYDVLADLTPIIHVAQYQAGIVVRPDAPWKSVTELVAYAKSKPDAIRYSTAGVGTQQHLTMLRLGQMVGARWVHVPYKNGPEAITALERGDVEVMAQTAEWATHVRDGRLRLLAMFTPTRVQDFAQAPTLIESGYDLTAPSMLGIVGPKGMDAAVVETLHNAFRKAMQGEAFTQCAYRFGLKTDYLGPAAYAKFIQGLVNDWAPTIKSVATD